MIVTYTIPYCNVKNISKKIIEAKPATTNRELAMRSKAFHLAVKERLEENPVSMVPKAKDVGVRVYINTRRLFV